MFKAVSCLKIKVEFKPVVDTIVFRLHYRYTYLIFMVSMVLSQVYDIVGKQIECMTTVDSDSFKDVVNSYCFIMGTFTVDSLHGPIKDVGVKIPHQGVGPMAPEEPITYHSYYQWVPFVLFIQGVMFYLPHWIWKGLEKGLFRVIIQDLSIKDYLSVNLKTYQNREGRYDALSTYLRDHKNSHQSWAYKFFLCEFLNLVVVVGMLFFTNWFLGGEFLGYGANVFEVVGLDPENRTDPMSMVFPRMAKCTFKSFGASGTIQVHDVMCLIATNIVNEKIYLFLWVWLILLTAITSLYMLYRFLTIILPFFRHFLLKSRVDRAKHREVAVLMHNISITNWFLLYNLAKNMERSVFTEFVEYMAKGVREDADTPPIMDNEEKKLRL